MFRVSHDDASKFFWNSPAINLENTTNYCQECTKTHTVNPVRARVYSLWNNTCPNVILFTSLHARVCEGGSECERMKSVEMQLHRRWWLEFVFTRGTANEHTHTDYFCKTGRQYSLSGLTDNQQNIAHDWLTLETKTEITDVWKTV